MKQRGWLTALGLAVLLAPPVASAEGPATVPSATDARPHRFQASERDAVLQRLREQGIELPSALPPLPVVPSASGSAAPPSSAAALAEDLTRKWRAFTASRHVRRAEHHAALVRELGSHLQDPAVKEELRLHSVRAAELARIRFLAENARQGAERQKLLTRVEKLTERESRRHSRRLATLAGTKEGPR